jgi:hypothetical protein
MRDIVDNCSQSLFQEPSQNAYSIYGVDAARFAHRVARFYGRSNAGQRAVILNRLLSAATGHSDGRESWAPITEHEAAAVSPDTVKDIANESARRDPSVIDGILAPAAELDESAEAMTPEQTLICASLAKEVFDERNRDQRQADCLATSATAIAEV